MRRFLLVSLLAIVLCCNAKTNTLKPEFNLSPLNPIVREAWTAAKFIGEGDPRWEVPTSIVVMRAIVVSGDGKRVLGRYITYVDVKRNGKFITVEQVLIYILPHEDDTLQEVLTHEFLHAVWQRRGVKNREFQLANPDSEVWVCSLVPCQS